MAGVLTAAEARDVVQHFRMPRCERVHSLNHLRRPRRRIRTRRKRRQLAGIGGGGGGVNCGLLVSGTSTPGGRGRGQRECLRIPSRSPFGSASHPVSAELTNSGRYDTPHEVKFIFEILARPWTLTPGAGNLT